MNDDIRAPEHQLRPQAGAVVTYVDPTDRGWSPFCRAVATGGILVDPDTQRSWLPALRPDIGAVLLDPASLVDITPWGVRAS